MKRRLLNLLPIASLALLLVVMALWPRFGPPHFRYTGSDPTRPVWNLGWPFALAIYDPSNGFHVGPFGLIAAYAVVLAAGAWGAAWWLVRQTVAVRANGSAETRAATVPQHRRGR